METAVGNEEFDLVQAVMASVQSSEFLKRACSWLFALMICSGLALSFKSDGWRRIVLLYIFLAALVTTQMTVHWVLHDLRFPHSSFLTFLQFGALWITAWPCASREHWRITEVDGRTPMRFDSRRFLHFYSHRVLPIAITIAVSVAANNASLGLIDPSFNAVLGNMTPALTAVLSALCGARLGRLGWLAVLLALAGGCCTLRGGLKSAIGPVRAAEDAAISIRGGLPDTLPAALESDASASAEQWLGVALSFGAMFFRSLKTVVMDRSVRRSPSKRRRKSYLLEEREESLAAGMEDLEYPPLAPMQLLLLQTPAIALVLLFFAAMDDDGLSAPVASLWRAFAAAAGASSPQPLGGAPDLLAAPGREAHPLLLVGLLLNMFCAGVLNIVGICVVQQIGATAMQIVGKCNIFIVMAFTAAYLGKPISFWEVVGALIVLSSAKLFSLSSKAERRVESADGGVADVGADGAEASDDAAACSAQLARRRCVDEVKAKRLLAEV